MQHRDEDVRTTAQTALENDQDFRAHRAAITKRMTANRVPTIPAFALDCTTLSRKILIHANGQFGPEPACADQPPSLNRVTGDLAVDEAFDGLKAVYELFCQVYQRPTINGDKDVVAVVHYEYEPGVPYPNAFWDSVSRRMYFGDGDVNGYLTRFTRSLDIIGHEVTHGIMLSHVALKRTNQPGALSESIPDVFGSMVKQYAHRQTVDQADWLIGDLLFTDKVKKPAALRSLKAPGSAFRDPDTIGSDPQPKHFDDYVKPETLDEPNEAIYINCGIPNHAFYLASMEIGGTAWNTTGQIWYNALTDTKFVRDYGFERFARLTHEHARTLFGVSSREAAAVQNGWRQVGVSIE
ncbi:MAG: M4 family metallopeptidase [bacterium]|nr:M4 family metallopeptidase [bacterium]